MRQVARDAGAYLQFPIILAANGAVMDGVHRVAKAVLRGRREIEAVRFAQDPPPDHVGRGPMDLPYYEYVADAA
jgi:hypothetical protein